MNMFQLKETSTMGVAPVKAVGDYRDTTEFDRKAWMSRLGAAKTDFTEPLLQKLHSALGINV
jgi:hypothetical protein